MHTTHHRFTIGVSLALGLAGWLLLRLAPTASWADDARAIQPAVAQPSPTNPRTANEHLRLAAEHLEAAGEAGLAQHVRQLVNRGPRLSGPSPRELNAPLYGDLPAIEPPSRLKPPTDESPRWKLQYALPPELDDGHMRYVQPARNRVEAREVRAVPAPQREPI